MKKIEELGKSVYGLEKRISNLETSKKSLLEAYWKITDDINALMDYLKIVRGFRVRDGESKMTINQGVSYPDDINK